MKHHNLVYLIENEVYFSILTLVSCVIKNIGTGRSTMLVLCYLLKTLSKFLESDCVSKDIEKFRHSIMSYISTLFDYWRDRDLDMDDFVVCGALMSNITRPLLETKGSMLYEFFINMLEQSDI